MTPLPPASFLVQIGSGIGRMILKEEMKARSGSYDNDPWGSARNSRSGSKETLHTTGYGTPAYNNTVNGCKNPPCPLCVALFVSRAKQHMSSRAFAPSVIICLCFIDLGICCHVGLRRGQRGCGCRSGRVMAAAGVAVY